MSSLLAIVSSGKGSWTHIQQLINNEKWQHIYLITNDFGKENFKTPSNATLIILDLKQPIPQLRDELVKQLKGKLDGDVGVNMVSGSGEEHMALLSALLKLGVGIRLVISGTNSSVEI